jgi:para-aminobenzoate synthetase component 1
MNELGRSRIPFFFIIDFDAANAELLRLDAVDPGTIMFDLDCKTNAPRRKGRPSGFRFEKHPIPYERYLTAFKLVRAEQERGNSYLLNLTFPTPVTTDLSFRDIYHFSSSRHGLYYKDKFVVFSPETFVTIRDCRIATRPMKGTIDAGVPGAESAIMADGKETAEHVTVVDLLRNDLGIMGRDVRVDKFRYVERLTTHDGELLQVSSLISAELDPDWPDKAGDIMSSLLPAGSVTGAPKKKTVAIIKAVEGYDRGFYTGVFGIFDGSSLDSAVMIRFMERTPEGIVFKSGGGITVYSDPAMEYKELVDKVYLPF